MKKTRNPFKEHFQKYITGEMTVSEKLKFAENLKSSRTHEKDFQDYEKINSFLENLERKNLQTEIFDESIFVSEFEKAQFLKKFKKPSKFSKNLSIFLKLAVTILLAVGVYQVSYFDFSQNLSNLFQQNAKYVIKDMSGRCYSNGVLLKKGDIFENSLIQSAKKSSCLIAIANAKKDFSIQIFPETELVNIQSEGREIWRLNQGKIYTESNQKNIRFLVKDHLISLDSGATFLEFEKSRLNVEAIRGKTQVAQNSSYLFGNGSRRIITRKESKTFEEKFPQIFGDLKSEVDQGTAYILNYDLDKLNQKESILQEMESMLFSDKKEISISAFGEIESFLKVSGPKIQAALAYIPEADFPFLKDNREKKLSEELLAFSSAQSDKINEKIALQSKEEVNEFAKEEEEYYKLAQENFNKKPALVFTLSLKDSTSLIGELSRKDGLYVIKTSEGREMEIPREQVALIELK